MILDLQNFLISPARLDRLLPNFAGRRVKAIIYIIPVKRCDQMHFTIGVTTRTSGHTKFAICNDFDRWHCSLVSLCGDLTARKRNRAKVSLERRVFLKVCESAAFHAVVLNDVNDV